MSRTVPPKLVTYGGKPIGISHKQFDISFNSLLPANSTGGSAFAPNGVNRILFSVPSYQNTFLDNARSYLSFNLSLSASDTVLCPSMGTSALFSRCVIRSGANIIEDIQNLDVLNKILVSMGDKDESRLSEGIYTREYGFENLDVTKAGLISTKQKSGVEMKYCFKHGILADHLKQFIPLHSMNMADGRAYQVELYLNDATRCLMHVGAGAVPTNPSYSLTNVKYNLCLLKADQTIISRLSNTNSGKIIIPFSTYRATQATLNAQSTVTQISEVCSDLRSVHTVIVSGDTHVIANLTEEYPTASAFRGGILDSQIQVEEYNTQVGNKLIFTEPLQSLTDNNAMMAQTKNASFAKGQMLLETLDFQANSIRPAYERALFSMTSSFTYENSDIMSNGISLSSLPLVMKLKLASTTGITGKTLLSFASCGYYLVIENGACRLVDSKDPSDFGM
jgi:hypothetical protein